MDKLMGGQIVCGGMNGQINAQMDAIWRYEWMEYGGMNCWKNVQVDGLWRDE